MPVFDAMSFVAPATLSGIHSVLFLLGQEHLQRQLRVGKYRHEVDQLVKQIIPCGMLRTDAGRLHLSAATLATDKDFPGRQRFHDSHAVTHQEIANLVTNGPQPCLLYFDQLVADDRINAIAVDEDLPAVWIFAIDRFQLLVECRFHDRLAVSCRLVGCES